MKRLIRVVGIICCLLLTFHVASATDYDLAKIMTELTARQKTVLYQYGTLQHYGGAPIADQFWKQHQVELIKINKEQANILANELLINTELVYTIKKPSRLQALRGVFTASRLLMGMAALIAAYSLIRLLRRFWYRIYDMAIKYLAPIFHLLFSPRILLFQLLLLALAAVCLGTQLQDVLLRTLVLQLGLAILWTQLAAITTRKYFDNLYFNTFKSNFDNITAKEAFIQITLPSFITTLAFASVIYRCNDPWYSYEIIIPAMITLYSFYPIQRSLKPIGRLLSPFPEVYRSERQQLASGYIILTLLVWAGSLFLPGVTVPSLVTITLLLTVLLLCAHITRFFSSHRVTIGNYIWIQLITIGYSFTCILIGSQLNITMLSWTGLGGLFFYILIKYWEVPSMLGWDWEHRKTLGILGMALLIWGLAMLIRSFPQWFLI